MDLCTSEVKVHNKVPVPELARISDICWQIKERNEVHKKSHMAIQTML